MDEVLDSYNPLGKYKINVYNLEGTHTDTHTHTPWAQSFYLKTCIFHSYNLRFRIKELFYASVSLPMKMGTMITPPLGGCYED